MRFPVLISDSPSSCRLAALSSQVILFDCLFLNSCWHLINPLTCEPHQTHYLCICAFSWRQRLLKNELAIKIVHWTLKQWIQLCRWYILWGHFIYVDSFLMWQLRSSLRLLVTQYSHSGQIRETMTPPGGRQQSGAGLNRLRSRAAKKHHVHIWGLISGQEMMPSWEHAYWTELN